MRLWRLDEFRVRCIYSVQVIRKLTIIQIGHDLNFAVLGPKVTFGVPEAALPPAHGTAPVVDSAASDPFASQEGLVSSAAQSVHSLNYLGLDTNHHP